VTSGTCSAVMDVSSQRVCVYLGCGDNTRRSVSRFVSSSWIRDVSTFLSLVFHHPIEVQAIFLEVSLHIAEGYFVRVRRSERDVKAG
jgi:hypothetical protein